MHGHTAETVMLNVHIGPSVTIYGLERIGIREVKLSYQHMISLDNNQVPSSNHRALLSDLHQEQ